MNATRLLPLSLVLMVLPWASACQAGRQPRVSRWTGAELDVVGKEHGYFERGSYVRDGKAVYWYDSSQKHMEGHFVDGERSGPWTFWYASGIKASEGSFSDGNRIGTWTSWDEQGRTLSEAAFEAGRLVQGTWDERMADLTGAGTTRRELDLGWDDPRNDAWMSRSNNYLNPRRSEFWDGHPSRVVGVTPEVLVQIRKTRND